ncbi:hypothetical protein [Cryobacterium shii]|uniref:Lipoprotein n=1 Tax=Cryobacterium shii TaxID=1259235 RepID=A0AAQ2HFP8_9MICO|nr:hypothetical protein [Cryobacterium shii]TFC48917.1 hypothetical protein E3O49_06825 [Cryobacterium shii]
MNAGVFSTRSLAVAGLLLVAGTLLTACSATGSTASVPSSGPWASEFAENYKRADSDFTRSVLVDGVISEQEFAETIDGFRRCLRSHEISISDYRFDGSFRTSFPPELGNDQANTLTKGCSRSSGEDLIASLYTWVHRNPKNVDETRIIVDCLIRSGVVSTAYKVDDYLAGAIADKYPFSDEKSGREALETCRMDPLGLGK